MVVVKKPKGKSDEWLIAQFRKKVTESGLLEDYRNNTRFKKGSEKRKEQKYRLAHMRALEKKRGY